MQVTNRPPVRNGFTVLKEKKTHGFILRIEMTKCAKCDTHRAKRPLGHGPYCYLYWKDNNGAWDMVLVGKQDTFPHIHSPHVVKAQLIKILKKCETAHLSLKERFRLQSLCNDIVRYASDEVDKLCLAGLKAIDREIRYGERLIRTTYARLIAKIDSGKKLTPRELRDYNSLWILLSSDH